MNRVIVTGGNSGVGKATAAALAAPPVQDVNAYLDYAQWVVEEIAPAV